MPKYLATLSPDLVMRNAPASFRNLIALILSSFVISAAGTPTSSTDSAMSSSRSSLTSWVIFFGGLPASEHASFCGQLEEIFTFLRERIDSSAGMLMHSLGNVRETGQERMESMQEVLEAAMVYRMEQDPGIRSDIWDETFTKRDYARFIMANMMLLLREHPYDFRFFLEIVKRTIY